MTDLLSIFLIAAFVENLALARFFDRVVNPLSTPPIGMRVAVAMLLAIGAACVVAAPALPPAAIAYLGALSLVACAITVAECGGRAIGNDGYHFDRRLRMALPIMVANAAVIAYVLIDRRRPHPWPETLGFCAGATLAFQAVVTLYPALAERLQASAIPARLRGTPISLLTAGIVSLAGLALPGTWP